MNIRTKLNWSKEVCASVRRINVDCYVEGRPIGIVHVDVGGTFDTDLIVGTFSTDLIVANPDVFEIADECLMSGKLVKFIGDFERCGRNMVVTKSFRDFRKAEE